MWGFCGGNWDRVGWDRGVGGGVGGFEGNFGVKGLGVVGLGLVRGIVCERGRGDNKYYGRWGMVLFKHLFLLGV
ncbi:unnamed protein product [Moneuplotes crassus]|uniref:Uncharacterized protein n=1 Tax=Euplotes crassus TaxID=5936 RepID=A0AAD2D1B8_EUPCR|nr:unnamed protein product [Moneuplotes crassus]